MRTTTPLLSLVAASLVFTPFVATQAQNEQFIAPVPMPRVAPGSGAAWKITWSCSTSATAGSVA